MNKIIYLFLLCLFISCKDSESDSTYQNTDDSSYHESDDETDYEEDEDDYEQGIEDGDYWASVDYYNPETGYSATYTLEVEVYDNEITTIYFPNDGYLDDSHIYAEELDDDGYAFIQGNDGRTFEVQLDK